jgi:glycerol transport system ATP-binding protein
MARIHLDRIAHSYTPAPKADAVWALRRLDLTWRDGGAYALLGPSGCGKTTLLNVISGLVQPSEGRVTFDGVDVTGLSTELRNIAQVFQFPVIYDTMTVFENLAFPLRNRGVGQAETRARVEEVAGMLGLTSDLHHRARGLTADSKQKISLGRGLVRSDVAAILFDEPLTVIDPQLKFQLRRQIKQIHEDSRLTFIYVTHDQNEALTFADQVVLMSEGAVVQAGTPQELFENPKHTFVGYFIGSPGMNILPCALDGDAAVVEGRRFPLGGERIEKARRRGGRLELGIRPEFVGVSAHKEAGAAPATIAAVEDLGNYKIIDARLEKSILKAKLSEDREVPAGEAYVRFPPEWTKLYADGTLVE